MESKCQLRTKKLLETLGKLPQDFQLVPVNGKKRPLGHEWQHNTLTPKALLNELLLGGIRVKAKKGKKITAWLPQEGKTPGEYEIGGFGILNGSPTKIEGKTFLLMSIDCDGESAVEALKVLSKSSTRPKTVAFSSGRASHCQYLFLIPEELEESIKTRKITTDKEKNEQLEFRWKGLISILPPSAHPETGKYQWRRSINTTPIAIAPEWAIEVMQGKITLAQTIKSGRKKLSIIQNDKQRKTIYTGNWTRRTTSGSGENELKRALRLLEKIPGELADGYWEWLKVGTALKTVSESLLPEWKEWSKQSEKYKEGECEYLWQRLKQGRVTIGTLYYFAHGGR
jgi:hypothetical protein